MPTRRTFLASSALTLLRPAALFAQAPPPAQPLPPAPTTRPNIALIDHDRILAAAAKALDQPPAPTPDLQSDAFLAFTLNIPALAAAALLSSSQPDIPNAARYSSHAADHLRAWFVTPATRLPTTPAFPLFNGITDLVALAETAQAIPFLALQPDLLTPLRQWFADYLTFLTQSRLALLARDQKDHNGSSWLLQVAAFARLTANEPVLVEARHRFKTVTIRAQINADGLFPHELPSPNPYRDSLFNLDLLSAACVLLSTRFESVWDYELQDGPGMRAVIARFAPYIANRNKWPFPADQTHFKDLPCRRPALVFAGRAFTQPDYVTLWRTLTPEPASPEILRTFPIRQPILWLTQPRPQTII